jgi:hypothetical protein
VIEFKGKIRVFNRLTVPLPVLPALKKEIMIVNSFGTISAYTV